MRNQQESIEQSMLIEYLRVRKYFVFSITNENNHSFLNKLVSIRIESKNKKMGKIKGTPDLVVFCKNNNKTLFIELKRKKKILKNGSESKINLASSEQIEFINEINNNDKYIDNVRIGKVCYGWEDAKLFIQEQDQ